jgi:hypothetical protein
VKRLVVFLCVDCGIELDTHDVDANLASWGVFRSLCSDCCEYHPEYI